MAMKGSGKPAVMSALQASSVKALSCILLTTFAVELLLIVNEVPFTMEATVVPAGMPVPVTLMPTTMPVVLVPVTRLDRRVRVPANV